MFPVHVERMENDRIAKRVYVEEFGCQASKENGAGQESMARFCEWECIGRSPEDETLILMRCHSCGMPQ